MPSTRIQEAEARKFRKMDMIFDFDNLDIMIGNGNNNLTERELANSIGESTVQYDIESNPHPRENSPKGNGFRNCSHKNNIPGQNRILELIETFTNELNLRLSQEMDSMMSMMHSQVNRAICSAISDRVIPERRIYSEFNVVLTK